MKKFKIGLLPKIIIAIILGIVLGQILPLQGIRVFSTFNNLFSEFLSFCIPLIILGLVCVAIANMGKGAKKMLVLTVLIAYGATLFSGFMAYGTSILTFPHLINFKDSLQILSNEISEPISYFSVKIPPLLDVMTALVLAFMLGLGMSALESSKLKDVCSDFENIITKVITSIIIPLLPLYIFGIFLNMTYTGKVYSIIVVFIKIIGVIFLLHILLLLLQFIIAGIVAKKNPFKLLWNMLPAYFTALGTQSSAATIPVTIAQSKKNGVKNEVASFVVPLCATIHLSGSTLKIVSCAIALMMMLGMPIEVNQIASFIFMLGITMIAAPGVPGGAIMACLGILSSILGFDENSQALMIALYIAMDSFGTACNVTGDGAIAVIMNKITKKDS